MRIRITTPTKSFDYTPPAGRSNFTIGKRAGNDVILEGSDTACNLHVRIESFINRWSFTDQFTDIGTLHNGERQFSHELQPGDVLTVGDCKVEVLSIGGETTPPAAVEESLTPMFDTGPDYGYVRPPEPTAPSPAGAALVWGRDKVHEDLCEDDLDDPLFQGYLSGLLIGRQPSAAELLELQLEAHRLATETRRSASDSEIESRILPLLNQARGGAQGQAPAAPAADTRQPPAAHVQRIAGWALFEFFKATGHDLSKDRQAMTRVNEAAAKAVIELDSVKSTEINLPFIAATPAGPQHLNVTLERKHLHQEPGKPVERELRRPEPVAYGGDSFAMFERKKEASKKAHGKGLGGALAGVIIMVAVAGVIFGNLDGCQDQVTPPGVEAPSAKVIASKGPTEKEVREELEAELKAAVRELMLDKQMPAPEKLDTLNAIEEAAELHSVNLGNDARRARTLFEQAITTEVSREHQAAISDVYERRNEKDYVAARARVDALEAWVAATEHRTEPARRYSVPGWIEARRLEIDKDSVAHIHEYLYRADLLLARHDYAAAVPMLQAVLRAVMPDEDRTHFEAELARYDALAQPGSGAPDVIPAFDRTKDRLPPGNTGKLFHAGESGARSRWNNMRSNLASDLWEGKVESITGRAYGREFALEPVSGRSDDDLVISRPHGDGLYVYRVRMRLANMPAEFQFAIMDAVERTELPELMAMLVFCFDNGLMDDAGRMAARVKAAAPDLQEALDTYLAAKWKTEIPEGSFPERDGRIVRE